MEDLFQRIVEAHKGLRPHVPVSPLEPSRALSEMLGCEVLLKCEHLQPTGSFKIRGSGNKLRLLDKGQLSRGVTTASTGNHGQGVARHAARLGTTVTVYISNTSSASKVAAIRALGAEIVVVDGLPIMAEIEARKQAGLQNKTYIPPYNDLDVMAGQGTTGMELAEQAPDLDAVFISVGGGGLIGGTGTALKKLSPKTRIVGVWPENSTCMLQAINAGGIIDVEEYPTLSDGTEGAIEPGSVTYPVCRDVIDEMVTVSEAEIAAAMRQIASSERWIIEGSAGVAVAGLIKTAKQWAGRKVAVVLCGRNIALETFLSAVSKPEAA